MGAKHNPIPQVYNDDVRDLLPGPPSSKATGGGPSLDIRKDSDGLTQVRPPDPGGSHAFLRRKEGAYVHAKGQRRLDPPAIFAAKPRPAIGRHSAYVHAIGPHPPAVFPNRNGAQLSTLTLHLNLNPEQIPGMVQEAISTVEDAMRVISRGNSNRATASTNIHEHSSRSHSILMVEVSSVLGG